MKDPSSWRWLLRALFSAAWVAGFSLIGGGQACAANNALWAGTSTNTADWATGSDWATTGGSGFVNNNSFNATVGSSTNVTSTTISFSTSSTAKSLTFGTSSQSFTIGTLGGNTLTLDANSASTNLQTNLVDNNVHTVTFNNGVLYTDTTAGGPTPLDIDNAGKGSLTFNGPLTFENAGSGTLGSQALENDSNGTININGAFTAVSTKPLVFTGAGSGAFNFGTAGSVSTLGTIDVASNSTVNFGTSVTATTLTLGADGGVGTAGNSVDGQATVYLTGSGITLTSAITESTTNSSSSFTLGSMDANATSSNQAVNLVQGNWTLASGNHSDFISATNNNTLAINGVISGGNVNGTLEIDGAGTVYLEKANTFLSQLTFGSGSNAGTVEIGNNSALGKGTLVLTNGAEVEDDSSAYTVTNTISLTGTTVLADASVISGTNPGLTFTGNVTLGGDATLSPLLASQTTAFTGVISGSNKITKGDPGTLILTGANTFTGGTDSILLKRGVIQINNVAGNGNAQALGEGNLEYSNSSANAEAVVYTGGKGSFGNAITIDNGADAVFDNNGGANLTLATAGGVTNNGGIFNLSGGEFLVNGAITGTSNGAVLTLGNPNFNGAAVVALNNNGNTYGGYTLITGGSTLITAVSSALPDPGVTFGASTDTPGTTNTLDLDGTAQTISALAIASTTNGVVNQVINSNATTTVNTVASGTSSNSTAGTLNFDVSSTNSVFAGSLGGSGAATNFGLNVIDGGGSLELTGTNTYTGNTTVQFGTLQLASGSSLVSTNMTLGSGTNSGVFELGSGSTAGNLTLTSLTTSGTGTGNIFEGGSSTNSLLTLNLPSGTATFGGTLGGGSANNKHLALTLTGTGTLNLTGTNNYTGATSVNSGTLEISGNGSLGGTAVTISSNATFSVSNSTTIGTTSLGSLTLNTGSTLKLQGGGAGNTLGLLNTSGTTLTLGTGGGTIALTFDVASAADEITLTNSAVAAMGSGTTVNVFVNGLGSLNGTQQTLISAPGGGLGTSGFVLETPTGTLNGGGFVYTLSLTETANNLFLNETPVPPPAVAYWTGSQGTVWNTINVASVNWSADADGATNTVSLPASPTDVFFAANSIAGTNTTLGTNFTINSLNFTSANSFGIGTSSNSLTILATTTSNNAAPNGISVSGGAGADTISANVVLGTNQTWTNNGNTFTVSGKVSDGGGALALTTAGTGTIVLSGTNTYTGATTVSAGTLQIGSGSSGSIASTSATVSSNATLAFKMANGASYGGGISDNGAVVGLEAASSSNTLSGNISGGGVFTQTGAGVTILTGTNSYTGGTSVQSGTLQLSSGGSLSSLNAVVLGSGTNSGVFKLGSGATPDSTTVTSLSTSGTGTSNSVVGGSTAVSTLTINLASGTDTFGGKLGGTTTTNNHLALTLTGAGTLNLTNTNTYSGGTFIDGGAISINTVAASGTAQALGTGTNVTFAGTVSAPGILQYTGSGGTLGQSLTVSPGDYGLVDNSGGHVLTLSGTISKNGSVLDLAGGQFVVSGVISGSNSSSDLDLGSTLYPGTATVALNTTNTYNGPTYINDGSTLITGTNNALPTASNTAVTLGTNSDTGTTVNTLDLDGTSETVASLTGNGSGLNQVISSNATVTGTNIASGSGNSTGTGLLTVNTTPNDTFSGNLGGGSFGNNFGLTKSGPGTLTLSGNNTYTGATTISGGAINVTGTTQNTATTVATGGLLQGTGTVGAITVKSGATLSPGSGFSLGANLSTSSSNVLTAASLTVAGGATLSYNLYNATASSGTTTNPAGGTFINLGTGAFMSDGTVNTTSNQVMLNFNYTASSGDVGEPNVYDLVEFGNPGGTDPNGLTNLTTTDFSITNLSGVLANNSASLQFTYIGGNEEVLQLDVIPEPGTWALFALGLGLLFVAARKRLRLYRK